MVFFFETKLKNIFALQSDESFSNEQISKLEWLFGNSKFLSKNQIKNNFIGPRAAMVSPWSTNAVEITQNMGINSIMRIEKYYLDDDNFIDFDPMLNEKFTTLNQEIFDINIEPEKIKYIKNINDYNLKEGLSLSDKEIDYLNSVNWNKIHYFVAETKSLFNTVQSSYRPRNRPNNGSRPIPTLVEFELHCE